jgi:hypothetical protein
MILFSSEEIIMYLGFSELMPLFLTNLEHVFQSFALDFYHAIINSKIGVHESSPNSSNLWNAQSNHLYSDVDSRRNPESRV